MMDVIFNRSDGNIERPLEGKEHVSGLLFYCDFATYESSDAGLTSVGVQKFTSLREARDFFAKKNFTGVFNDIIIYNIASFFEYNINGVLYICISSKPSGVNLYSDMLQLQKEANGEIRQLGVWDFNYNIDALESNIKNIQKQADTLEKHNSPLSVILAPRVSSYDLPAIEGSYKNVSVLVGLDADDPTVKKIHNTSVAKSKSGEISASSLGIILGITSKVRVNESIASVKKGRLNVTYDSLAFANSVSLRTVSEDLLKNIDSRGYIYMKSYAGIEGTYFSDSHTLGKGDYNTIEAVRTMDKAVRNIRARLIMELGSPLYIDSETGKLDPVTVKHLEVVAGKELEVMQKAGEISGWSVEIDPNQDVLGTSTVEFVIKKVPVGVLRKAVVNIGYTKKIGG